MKSITLNSGLFLFLVQLSSAVFYGDNELYLQYSDVTLLSSYYPVNDLYRQLNNPFVALTNRFFTRNPEFPPNIKSIFDSCTGSDGESGVCLPAAACSVYSGRPSGSCTIGSVCCINTITKCSGAITLNNTYWRASAPSLSPPSTCTVTVRVDQSLIEQKKYPICQLRLDFKQFTIAQPSSSSICEVDNFRIGGGNNQPQVICGDNDGQHMYVHVPPSGEKRTDVEMTFSFGAGASSARSWNIKVSMIPCSASYAAPADCLQYFTEATGTLKSFNWKDSVGATRELANHDYAICIRAEVIGGERATKICHRPCSVNNAGAAFSITGDDTSGISFDADCPTDHFLVLGSAVGDRVCGYTVAEPSFTACSSIRPFKVLYMTNGDETDDSNNVGFCVNYVQSVVKHTFTTIKIAKKQYN